MTNTWIREYEWSQSKNRIIDDSTLCDLIKLLEHQSERSSQLEKLGIFDNGALEDVLFVFILDALGVPPDGDRQVAGSDQAGCEFSRQWFNLMFYEEYLLNNAMHTWSPNDLLKIFKKELKDDLKRHYL